MQAADTAAEREGCAQRCGGVASAGPSVKLSAGPFKTKALTTEPALSTQSNEMICEILHDIVIVVYFYIREGAETPSRDWFLLE